MAADLTLTASLLLAVVSGWSGVWQEIADRARALSAPSPTPAVQATYAEPPQAPAGRVIHTGPVVAAGSFDGVDWRWDAGRVTVLESARIRQELRVTLAETQSLVLDGGDRIIPVTVTGESLGAVLRTDRRSRVATATLIGTRVTIRAAGLAFFAERIEIATMRRDKEVTDVELSVDGWALPPSLGLPPLDRPIEQARAAARLTAIGSAPPTTLAEWRDRGGLVHLLGASLDWARFHLDASGRVGLDGLMRPSGRLRLGMRGLPDAVRAAEAGGRLSSPARAKIEDMLNRIAAVRGEDDVGEVRLDLSLALAGGRLTWQGVPIARVPAVAAPSDCARADIAQSC